MFYIIKLWSPNLTVLKKMIQNKLIYDGDTQEDLKPIPGVLAGWSENENEDGWEVHLINANGYHIFRSSKQPSKDAVVETKRILRGLEHPGRFVGIKNGVIVFAEEPASEQGDENSETVLADAISENELHVAMENIELYDQPIFVCGIAWMKYYRGLSEYDIPKKGGKHVDEYENAHKVCNFIPTDDGWVYGHVESSLGAGRDTQIKLEKLNPKAHSQDILENVTVLWAATPENESGRRIVGWYRNATVYRNRQSFADQLVGQAFPTKQHDNDGIDTFRIKVKASDAFLLPINNRCDFILKGKTGGKKGWLGEKAWWYPLKKLDNSDVLMFLGRVIGELIRSNKWQPCSESAGLPELDSVPLIDDSDNETELPKAKASSKKSSSPVSYEENKKVEEAAVNLVKDFYFDRHDGYCHFTSVEKNNCGWDIEVRYAEDQIKYLTKVEVKGRSTDEPFIGLSPNEFRVFSKTPPERGYRLCIVTSALNSPNLYLCFFKGNDWLVKKYIPNGRRFVKLKNKKGDSCYDWVLDEETKALIITPVTSALITVT